MTARLQHHCLMRLGYRGRREDERPLHPAARNYHLSPHQIYRGHFPSCHHRYLKYAAENCYLLSSYCFHLAHETQVVALLTVMGEWFLNLLFHLLNLQWS